MKLLKPVDKCWQPADFLPDSSSPDFQDQARILADLCLSVAPVCSAGARALAGGRAAQAQRKPAG